MPLYEVTYGDLGTEPSILESQLRRTLLRAANWGAILLIDNADVLLNERNLYHLQHNALVSVFLRSLDCSEALVFLVTSHRVQHDASLESRIDFPLGLPDLSFTKQQDIWVAAIERVDMRERDREKITEFVMERLQNVDNGAHKSMNGHQIQHCVRAAAALAKGLVHDSDKETILTEDHVKKVLALGLKFKGYLGRLPAPKPSSMAWSTVPSVPSVPWTSQDP